MTKPNFRRTLVGAAVVAALGVLVTPVGAAPYRGVFDPTDFSGEYIIDVDPTCLLTDGWHANTGICAATLVSAVANVVSSSPEPTYSGQLTFAPPAITTDPPLFGIYVYGGQIDSFDTDLLAHVDASPSTDDLWFLQFASGHMPETPPPCDPYCEGMASAPATLPKGVYLSANDLGVIDTAEYIGPAVAIPEPGTLGLVLGALGGGWLARRRRKKQEADSS